MSKPMKDGKREIRARERSEMLRWNYGRKDALNGNREA
jgi:hypothetical protein